MKLNRQNSALLLLTFLNSAAALPSTEPTNAAAPQVHSPQITLRTVTTADGERFIEIDGQGFSCNTNVRLKYSISYATITSPNLSGEELIFSHSSTDGRSPSIDTFGEDVLSSDGAGKFMHRIRVTLTGQFGASVGVVDLASGLQTVGSLK
jgi:hypothetical protein